MEVLFENPVIIIAVLGFIFSLFKKKEGGNKEQKKAHHKPQYRPVSERTIEQQKPLHAETRELHSAEKSKLKRGYLERKKQAESTMNAWKEQQRLSENQAELIQLAADKPVNEPTLPIDRRPKASFSAGKQQLVDAVIWAEILGPPKARNPHRSLRGK